MCFSLIPKSTVRLALRKLDVISGFTRPAGYYSIP